MLRRYKTIDLFSGCGGMSLGFQNAGFEILAAYDNWKPAVDVYELNFEHPIYSEDLADEKVQKRIKAFKPNVIIGGPPCQDFSSAGHRDENLGRAVLTYTYRDIILRIKPKYFVMENVPEITKSAILKEIKDSFKEAGYGLTEVYHNRASASSWWAVLMTRMIFSKKNWTGTWLPHLCPCATTLVIRWESITISASQGVIADAACSALMNLAKQ